MTRIGPITTAALLLAACRADPPPRPKESLPWWAGTSGALDEWEPALQIAGEPPRNLLMISIDTLRRDAVGRWGGEDTPTLDGFFAGAVVLEDHLQCANWTYSAITCTLGGTANEEAGLWPTMSRRARGLPELPLLAGLLRDGGFHTILESSNGWFGPDTNLDQGYDEVHVGDGNAAQVWSRAAATLAAAEEAGADRWFLHVHVDDPHQPYAPPDEYLAGLDDLDPVPWDLGAHDPAYEATHEWPKLSAADQALLEAHLRVRYAGEVRWLDAQLAGIFADAEARGWLDDALVVLWTDHGEAFWEHGQQSHAWTLHAEENDAILAFSAPGLAPRAWDGPTSAVDLVPTLLALWDLPAPDTVTGLVLGSAAPWRARYAAVEARGGVEQHVVREGWKLRYDWAGEAALYDRRLDPAEADDRRDDERKLARELWEGLQPRIDLVRPLTRARAKTPPGL